MKDRPWPSHLTDQHCSEAVPSGRLPRDHPQAVSEAHANPRGIDPDLVDAQQARRSARRLVGYKVGPLLEEGQAGSPRASPDRGARIVVERSERSRVRASRILVDRSRAGKRAGRVSRRLQDIFRAGLQRVRRQENGPRHNADQPTLAWAALDGRTIDGRRHAKGSAAPAVPPSSTSTLSRRASSRVDSAFRRTMQLAQELYEGVDLDPGTRGLMPTIRTDSTVSPVLGPIGRPRLDRAVGTGPVRAERPSRLPQGKGAQEGPRSHPTNVPAGPGQCKPFPCVWLSAVLAHLAAVHCLSDESSCPRQTVVAERRGGSRDPASTLPVFPCGELSVQPRLVCVSS